MPNAGYFLKIESISPSYLEMQARTTAWNLARIVVFMYPILSPSQVHARRCAEHTRSHDPCRNRTRHHHHCTRRSSSESLGSFRKDGRPSEQSGGPQHNPSPIFSYLTYFPGFCWPVSSLHPHAHTSKAHPIGLRHNQVAPHNLEKTGRSNRPLADRDRSGSYTPPEVL